MLNTQTTSALNSMRRSGSIIVPCWTCVGWRKRLSGSMFGVIMVDNFNVPSVESEHNYFRNYSMQGRKHPRSYRHQVQRGTEVYSFVAVDACLEPGPRRPFNFIGLLTQRDIDTLQQMMEDAPTNGSHFAIWFGHYPTSCIVSPGNKVRSVIGGHVSGLAYLCGHLHMMGGVVPNMYTLQQAGYLELELADWKDNRMYRVAAIDHGLFSFVDVKNREWPVVLVTNPKDVLFNIPLREPLSSVAQSTHIRVLAFSPFGVDYVQVKIDDGAWADCQPIEGSLYVRRWHPVLYPTALHDLHVKAVDNAGNEKLVVQPFSLDGTQTSFSLLPRLLLMTSFSTAFQILFGLALMGCVIPLCSLRVCDRLVKADKMVRPRLRPPLLHWWLRKLWILSNVNRIFYPLVLYPLYLTVGPWSVGEVVDNHVGVIFAWGTIVNGTYLPGSFTYAFGFLQLFTFHAPLIVLLAHRLDKRLESRRVEGRSRAQSVLVYTWDNLLFWLLVCMQASFAYSFWLSFGTMALLLGPLRTWPVLLSLWLWRLASTLPEPQIREAAWVWLSPSRAPIQIGVISSAPDLQDRT